MKGGNEAMRHGKNIIITTEKHADDKKTHITTDTNTHCVAQNTQHCTTEQ